MAKNEKRVCIVLAIILAVFAVVSLAVPFVKGGVFLLSFVFGIVAIAVQLYVLKSAFGKNESPRSKFYGFPIAKIGFVYMVVQLLLSFMFMAIGFICPIWIPVIIYVLLLGITAIGFIAADVTRDEIERQDVVLKADTECMQSLRSIVYPLSGQIADIECSKLLKNLAEEFKYSDPVSSESIKDIEGELAALVGELQNAVVDTDVEAIEALCQKINVTLTERNRLCKLTKRN